MKATTLALFAASSLIHLASAHMALTNPAPLRSKSNRFVTEANIDYSMTSPLLADGSNYPCKGYLSDSAGKESVATWKAGSAQTITVEGGANHNGGSCQLSISEDGGKSFKVIKSFIGNCPSSTSVKLDVDIPSDTKTGEAIFAWSWNNRVGNREMYMNCAIVTIEDGGSGLDSYPDIFVAQLATTTCAIAEGTDVDYPNPGKSVERADGDSATGAPTGDCGAVSGGGSGSSTTKASTVGATTTKASTSVQATSTPASATEVSTSADATTTPASTDESSSAAETATETATDIPASSTDVNLPPSPSLPSTPSSSSVDSAPSATSSPAPSSPSGSSCTEGQVTCNSDNTWSQCGSGRVQNMGSVPSGMTCKDGAIVAAVSSLLANTCTTEGAITCNEDNTWSQCGSGYWQLQGSVPAGMACKSGKIVAADRRRRHIARHARSWQSRRVSHAI